MVAAAAAATPKGTLGCLLYLVDMDNSKRYLVDSGSAFSILPHKSSGEPTGPRLMASHSTAWTPHVHLPNQDEAVLLDLPAGTRGLSHTRS